MNNITSKTTKLVLTSLMAALCFVATYIIRIPTVTNGYIHLGDGFVLLSGVLLGPVYGFLAAAIGSMLTDLLAGYAQYAIVTFFVKGLVAAVTGLIFKKSMKSKSEKILFTVISGLIGTIIVCLGYYLFESTLMGLGFMPALAGVFSNALQGAAGTVVATLLVPSLSKIVILKYQRA